jgi:hypothetical protein
VADNTITLEDFLTNVREHADLEDLEDRHSDEQLTRFINLEWRLLRTKVTNAGFSYFIEPSAVDQLPGAPVVSGEQYMEVDYPEGAVGVYGIDVKIGAVWLPMKPGSFASRRDYQSTGGARGGVPTHYIVRSVAKENQDAVDAGKIMLYPLTSGTNDYKVWYLPVWQFIDVANLDYVFYGHDIWFDWALQGVVRRAAQKDDDSQNTLAEARTRQAELWADIKRAIQNMNLAEPITPRRAIRRGRRY